MDGKNGTVYGISSEGVIFNYIVHLDSPVLVNGEMHLALSVPGTNLMGVDGTDYRLHEAHPSRPSQRAS
jgi:hypothetical protein